MGERHVQRKDFVVPRCTDACPAGIDVPRYIRAVRAQKYDEALAVIREKIPFPTVCADACFAPCEEVCAYKQLGDPIAIRAIKRTAADKGVDVWKKRKKGADKTGKSVAVIGSGPAGLTAAYYLSGRGHGVTLFDAFPKPGGMMRYGIPDYRLPEERLDRDIDDILEQGVVFKGNTTIGKDIDFEQVKSDFDAVFLAGGCNGSVRIPLEGSEKTGVLWGWDFLKDVALGEKFDFDGDVIVVGGGNVAIDVALTAKRLGAEEVSLFCLEKREEMPAHEWEIARAEEEGIVIYNAWAPRKVLGDDRVSGLRLIRCTAVFNEAGKFSPAYDEEVTTRADATTVILAVGQAANLDFLAGDEEIHTDAGRIAVKGDGLSTGEPGVYAGGDVVTGPASIIDAIAQGREAASALDRYLGGNGNIEEILAEPEDEVALEPFVLETAPRNELPLLKPWERVSGFEQVEQGLSDAQVSAETARCIYCDARKFEVVLNIENCKECGYCAEVCAVGTFAPADFFNAKGYRPEEVKSSDWCVGCFKCFFSCPDFAIDVIEVTA